MDRYNWRDALGQLYEIAPGGGEQVICLRQQGPEDFVQVCWDGPAAEVLRLATRLKEAEELLADPDIQWGGGGWKDYGSCPLCGGKVKSEGGQGHEPSCRLHFFLASGKEGA